MLKRLLLSKHTHTHIVKISRPWAITINIIPLSFRAKTRLRFAPFKALLEGESLALDFKAITYNTTLPSWLTFVAQHVRRTSPHLAELAMTQLVLEGQRLAGDLPLVPDAAGHVRRKWLVAWAGWCQRAAQTFGLHCRLRSKQVSLRVPEALHYTSAVEMTQDS